MRRLLNTPSVALALALCGCSSSSASGPSGEPADAARADAGASLDAELDAVPANAPDGDPADAASPDTPDAPAFRPAEAEDFRCLPETTPVRGFFVDNYLGDVEGARAAAEEPGARPFPAGSIVQLIPQEAMVRLPDGTSPETGDWEYFLLDPSDGTTRILSRGGAEVENAAGSCNSCHAAAASRNFVCEQTGLCADAAIPRVVVDSLVASDARCR